ncbi:MAG: class F sortase, partial [Dermatophilaceae bacterium]|nr:class F sortase [Dermatophilaceae bacterium]
MPPYAAAFVALATLGGCTGSDPGPTTTTPPATSTTAATTTAAPATTSKTTPT